MTERPLVMREYNATVGETDGNIIAAIITTQTPRNQPAPPRLVHGPLSMPRIRSTVHHHPIPARPNSSTMSASRPLAAAKATASPSPESGCSADAIKCSGGPGELGRREAGPSLVLDAEGIDARA